MSAGGNTISNLSADEYRAAISAIKLVRGDQVKNAYIEGWREGHNQCQQKYKGCLDKGDRVCWEESHAKFIQDKQEKL